MRLANLILAVAFLFGFSACPPGKVCLAPPTVIPTTLDEAYLLVDEGAGNWVFTGECTLSPRITWAQVRQIADATKEDDTARVVISTADLVALGVVVPKAGTLDISEEELFALTGQVVLRGAWQHHERVTCKPDGDKVALQGATVTDLLNALADYVR